MMNFFLIFFAFVSTVSVIQSRETLGDMKSFKVNDNITFDCVDIYKQPSLSNPLLKNHKIQLKPSFAVFKSNNTVNHENASKMKFECPYGTVPILRNTKEYTANAQSMAEKHFNVLTVDKPGEHFAGVSPQNQGPFRGVAASISVHDLNIIEDQTSYAYIYVGAGIGDTANYIQTGWMVSPSLFGDRRTWSYGYWKGAKGQGCYNTMCPGFIQVSKTDPISGLLSYPSGGGERDIYISIQQDKVTGNWWATDIKYNGPDIQIGYWPKELFDNIVIAADEVGVTGAVKASPTGESPPMGNGHLPTDDARQSAHVTVLQIIDSIYNVQESNKYRLDSIVDGTKCYGLGGWGKSALFAFGGPGGNSCGV